MNTTEIYIEHSKSGAIVRFASTIPLDINCPRCGAKVEPGVEHRCGDRLKPTRRVRGAQPSTVVIEHPDGADLSGIEWDLRRKA